MIWDEHKQGEAQTLKQINRTDSNSPQDSESLPQFQGQYSPGRILVIIIGGIALAEVIAMLIVYNVRDLPYIQLVLLDAGIMTVIIFPLLYFLSFKPLLLHIQQRAQVESILHARLRLIQFADTHTIDELLQFTLDEIESLTGSSISFFHFLEADQKTITLQAWSTDTLQHMCTAEGKDAHYNLEEAGVWADAVRQRQPIIHNDYASLPHRKGTPEGHAVVVRELVVPVLRDNRVVAILGLGNKLQDYNSNDLELVSTLADFAWDVVNQKQADNALRQSEQKFRTFVNWTYDWEKWIDPNGNIVYSSPACERITGYSPEEFITDPNLLIRIIHPDDQQFYEAHQQIIHEETAGPTTIEYRIIARDTSEHWIEHICRPVFGSDLRYLGRRISDRDITNRKLDEKKIIEQNQKELSLTQTIQTIQTDIARDLHDTLGQNISFLNMSLAHISEERWSAPTFIQNQIQNMTKVANESYELIRAMLSILQFGTSTDPLSLFSRYAEQVAERSSLQINLTNHGNPNQLSSQQIRQLFYIFREALSNIEKYAQASVVAGKFLWDEHGVTLEITDNGRGFNPDAVQTTNHYGLKFMRQRAEIMKGSFIVQSAPDQGTTIKVVVPYEFVPST